MLILLLTSYRLCQHLKTSFLLFYSCSYAILLKGDEFMNMGELIKKRRTALKITQKELGQRLNVSQQMIGQWENSTDNNIKLSTLGRIADALDCHILDLLDDLSVDKYYESIDESLLAYYESIGYSIEFSDGDSIIISHNDYSYKANFNDYCGIVFNLECEAEKIIKDVIADHINTRFEKASKD